MPIARWCVTELRLAWSSKGLCCSWFFRARKTWFSSFLVMRWRQRLDDEPWCACHDHRADEMPCRTRNKCEASHRNECAVDFRFSVNVYNWMKRLNSLNDSSKRLLDRNASCILHNRSDVRRDESNDVDSKRIQSGIVFRRLCNCDEAEALGIKLETI